MKTNKDKPNENNRVSKTPQKSIKLSCLLALLVVASIFVLGCGGGGSTGTTSTAGVTMQVSPLSATLSPGASKSFIATVTGSSDTSVTWSCSGGIIDQSGNYVAPTQQGNYSVTATSNANPLLKSTAQVTVSQTSGVAISITPTTSTTGAGGQVQFSATVTGTTNTAVTWSATSGAVDSSGLYTAPTTAGIYRVTATSVANTKITAIASVTVTTGTVQILPRAPVLGTNETQQFSATVYNSSNQSVTWSATGGTISSSGLFQSPEIPGTYTVTATSVANTSSSVSVPVVVNATSVSIAPSTVTVVTGQTQQFTAQVTGPTNKTVTWSATGGTITSLGLFTAPTTSSTVTVTATSTTDPTKSASSTVTVVTPSTYFYDFNSGVPGVWTPTTNETTPSGVKFLGRISGTNAAQLVLNNLTTHSSITVTFDLYVIGAWGGIPSSSSMTVAVGGTTGFSQTFSNQTGILQSYPLSGSNAPGTGSTGENTLGYTSDPTILYNDSTYHITCNVAHTGTSVTITFTGNLTGTLASMAWGLKNVQVTANP